MSEDFSDELIVEARTNWDRNLMPFVLNLPQFDEVLTEIPVHFICQERCLKARWGCRVPIGNLRREKTDKAGSLTSKLAK